MMFDVSWKAWAGVAIIVTLIAGGLHLLGVIPWWGVLIAVPVATVAVIGAVLAFGILMWMAGGSH